ncbi:hypothetical protein BG844_03990 [Couchioplanes caeruleus subsp. caeruleus]|uniref:Aminoglycoside phosphotransferase domain-containing protein n=1 Tax=Couchioplanes caeruleus subsp. caeruleus TaxID=56427 RepID=A0A1K0GSX6_9ACTN|nr:hypothetical protein BG844_03990 [Couchioplanes caeruleus subsp. caeruleus]
MDGHPVTFWEVVPDSGSKVQAGELGSVLRAVHACPVPTQLDLPALNIFGRVEGRIDAASGIGGAVLTFLRKRLHDLVDAYEQLVFNGEPVALHGDAHVKNLIRTPEGEAVLIDFEGFCLGPREVDLAVTATEYEIGWHSDRDYENFCSTYGMDVRSRPGFQILRDVNLLKMTTWLMQNVQESREVADEFERRLEALRCPAKLAGLAWQPF